MQRKHSAAACVDPFSANTRLHPVECKLTSCLRCAPVAPCHMIPGGRRTLRTGHQLSTARLSLTITSAPASLQQPLAALVSSITAAPCSCRTRLPASRTACSEPRRRAGALSMICSCPHNLHGRVPSREGVAGHQVSCATVAHDDHLFVAVVAKRMLASSSTRLVEGHEP